MKKISNKDLQILISKEAIDEKIASLALEINQIYQNQDLVIVMILKGSICFAADLIRKLTVPFTLEMIKCESYGMRGDKRGDLTILGVESLNLKDKNVLLLDDIHDTGQTLKTVIDLFKEKMPSSVRSAVLLSKPEKNTSGYSPDYSLFSIGDDFVIGYGLDFKEHFRGLPGIYKFMGQIGDVL
jgi:hypoxanthine phosphoribosyltransferase